MPWSKTILVGDSNHPRVCWLPFSLDGRSGSTAYRCWLPARELTHQGFSSEVWTDATSRPVARSKADVAVFQKRYSWSDVRFAESLQAAGTKICFDLCDNHRYALQLRDDSDRLRALALMEELADVITVPTPTMARFVSHSRVRIVDDAIERRSPTILRRSLLRRKMRKPLRVLWFGSAGTDVPQFGLPALAAEIPVLEEAAKEVALHLTVLSNDRQIYERSVTTDAFSHTYREWKSDRAAHRVIASADVCILPVPINPFTIGKSANRAVLSLLLGVPVIATPHPAYAGLESLLAISNDVGSELRRFAKRPDVFTRPQIAVDDGLKRFSPAVVAERWNEVLSTL